MARVYTYPKSVKMFDANEKELMNIVTQLYKIGIYVAVYEGGNIAGQLNLTPREAVKFMQQFEIDNLKNGATSEFGPNISVYKNDDGFFEERKRKCAK